MIIRRFPLRFCRLSQASASCSLRPGRDPVVLENLLQLVLGVVRIVDNHPVATGTVGAVVVLAAAVPVRAVVVAAATVPIRAVVVAAAAVPIRAVVVAAAAVPIRAVVVAAAAVPI